MKLLVTVDSEASAAQIADHLRDDPAVTVVSGHPDGCCCKNCPWNGDHG